jgi:hypothetical protein
MPLAMLGDIDTSPARNGEMVDFRSPKKCSHLGVEQAGDTVAEGIDAQ